MARITLRLPQSVKTRVDEMASSEGISTNAWLIRAVMDALADRSGSRYGVAAAAASTSAAVAECDLRRQVAHSDRTASLARRVRSGPAAYLVTA